MTLTKEDRRVLAVARRRCRATLEEVARMMGVHRSTVLRLENGEARNPSIPLIVAWKTTIKRIEDDYEARLHRSLGEPQPIEGYCPRCFEQGHLASDCTKTDSEVEVSRAAACDTYANELNADDGNPANTEEDK